MKTKGVERVTILVKDLDKAVALYSELLNTTFYPVDMAVDFGVRAAFSYDAGIEMSAPIPGSDSPMAQVLAQHIEEHGEGLYAVVFSIDDVEQAHAKAKEMGIFVMYMLELDQDEIDIYFQGMYSKYIEYVLHPEDTCGAQVLLGQFEPPKNR